MAIKKGWYQLDRSIIDGPVWKTDEPFGIRDAYIDLLLMANYEEKTFIPHHSNNPIIIKPGQLVTSYEGMAKRWKWTIKRTRNYINLLEKALLIRKKSYNWGTVLTLVEYGKSKNDGISNDHAPDQTQGTPDYLTPDHARGIRCKKDNKDIKEGHNNKKNKQGAQAPLDCSGWDWGKPE